MMDFGVIGECNTSCAKMYGYKSTDKLIGKRMIDFYGTNFQMKIFKQT